MNNVFQNQIEALPISGFAPYFSHSSTSLSTEGIGSSVGNLIENTEKELFYSLWNSIESFPKDYLSDDTTQFNYHDKSFWERVLNNRIALLQDQLISGLQEKNSDNVEKVRDVGFTTVDRLKEQMSVDFCQNKLSIEKQLIDLQSIIGKYTLSPRCYESGLDALQETACDNTYYSSLVTNVRSSFHLSLKKQAKFLSDCFEGDVWYALNGSRDKSLTVGIINQILAYYKPLMKHKTYAIYKDWVEKCYNSESLLPPPSLFKKEIAASSALSDSPTIEHKQGSLNWKGTLYNWGKFLWENSGKLMTLALATQVAAVQASGVNNTEKEIIPKGNSTDNFPLLSEMTTLNQTFLTDDLSSYNLPVIISRSLDLTKDEKGLKLDIGTTIKSSRQKRAAPIKGSSVCTVKEEELKDLNNRMNDVLENPTKIQGNNNCQLYNGTAPRSCTELIDDIKCGVSHLINEFIQGNSGKISKEKFEIFKSQYDSLRTSYSNLYDSIEQSGGQVSNEVIQQKNDFIQNIRKKLDRVNSKLINKTRSLCISEIVNGKISIAFNQYLELQRYGYNPNYVIQIVETAYRNYEKKNKLENIIRFVSDLHVPPEKVGAYKKLFEEMKDDLSNPNVILLAYEVQNVIDLLNEFSFEPIYVSASQNLKNDIEVAVNNIIDAWAHTVRNGYDYQQITDFSKKYYDILESRLPLLIEKAYERNLENAKNILKLIGDLSHPKSTMIACLALYNNMKNNSDLDSSELIMLVYRVKQSIEMHNYPEDMQGFTNLQDIVKNLDSNLPSSVRRLIFNPHNCTINSFFGEYLYASDKESPYYPCRRNVFTWMNPADGPSTKDIWEIMPKHNASYFTIRNRHYGEYLYAEDKSFGFDYDRRNVFTFMEKNNWSNDSWTITPKYNASYFTIFNKHYKEYLYTPNEYFTYNDNSNNRRVFTWIPGGYFTKYYWKITC